MSSGRVSSSVAEADAALTQVQAFFTGELPGLALQNQALERLKEQIEHTIRRSRVSPSQSAAASTALKRATR
jgi:hypothetical protein